MLQKPTHKLLKAVKIIYKGCWTKISHKLWFILPLDCKYFQTAICRSVLPKFMQYIKIFFFQILIFYLYFQKAGLFARFYCKMVLLDEHHSEATTKLEILIWIVNDFEILQELNVMSLRNLSVLCWNHRMINYSFFSQKYCIFHSILYLFYRSLMYKSMLWCLETQIFKFLSFLQKDILLFIFCILYINLALV